MASGLPPGAVPVQDASGKWLPIPANAVGAGAPIPSGLPPKKDGNWLGFLHHVPGSKIISQTTKDLESAAIHVVPGLYDVGKGVAEDVGSAAHGDLAFQHSRDIGKAMIVSTLHDLEHPLRHPGYTLLDLWGITSGLGEVGARGAEIARAAKAGEGAGAVAKAALTKAPHGIRYIDGIQSLYSKNPVVRAGQKLADQAREKHPALGSPERKAGRQLVQDRRVNDALDKTIGNKLAGLARKLSMPEHVALRVVAEGKTIDERIGYHTSQAEDASFFSKRAHTAQAKLLDKARKYVDDSSGKPVIRPEFPKLQEVYDLAKEAADARTHILREVGLLKDTERVSAPGQVIEGTFESAARKAGDQIPGQLTVEDMLKEGGVPEHVFQGGEFRVPYSRQAVPLSLFRNPSFKGGVPRAPSSATHAFEGALLKSGVFRNDTARLVAESYMEAERFASLLRARDSMVNLAKDTPDDIPAKYRVPIRVGALKNFPLAVKDFLNQPEEHAAREGSLEHWRMFGHAYDALRAEIFPQHISQMDGVKWIDKRILGGLDKQNPLVGFSSHGAVSGSLKLADAINNASRLAILYLKPAYAVPNLLGNVAMNFVQQGFAAPKNVARAVRLAHTLGPDVHVVDGLMGEGFVQSLSNDVGIGHAVVQKAAAFWSKGVDLPFRRSSFLYEAQDAGFKTAEQIKSLLHDPAHHETLIDVVRRANKEIIDYADLNPVEKDIIRRVIFFYPWVKGSTKYAGSFVAEHPFKATAVGAIGQQGEQQVEKDFPGGLPSWDEGLFKVSGGAASPLAANSSAAAIFQTPADVVKTLTQLVGGNTTSAQALASYLSPVGAAELAALSRQTATGKAYKPNISALQIMAEELSGGIPLKTLIDRLNGKQSKAGSYDWKQALSAYAGLGSLTPHPVLPGVLASQAKREKTGG